MTEETKIDGAPDDPLAQLYFNLERDHKALREYAVKSREQAEELLAEFLVRFENHQDYGPHDNRWQSEPLTSLIEKAKAFVAGASPYDRAALSIQSTGGSHSLTETPRSSMAQPLPAALKAEKQLDAGPAAYEPASQCEPPTTSPLGVLPQSPSDPNAHVRGRWEDDPLYDQAAQLVVENKRASISLVQRHLKIGYNRAARLLEEMEKRGVVSPMNAGGVRSVNSQSGAKCEACGGGGLVPSGDPEYPMQKCPACSGRRSAA